MITLIASLVLLILSLMGVVIRKTYDSLPAKELKRQAQAGDPLAKELYKAVAYGSSLRAFLWLYVALTAAGGVVLLSHSVPTFISFVAVVGVLWLGFSWLPTRKVSSLGRRLTVRVTPWIVWLLNYLYPVLSRLTKRLQRGSTKQHTGLYEREDLLEFIERQQNQADSRVTSEELAIARRALQFSDFSVADVLTPSAQVPIVKPDETSGPILIDELHKTEQAYALVRAGAKADFVGWLDITRLGLKTAGKVSDIMNSTVYYIHENDDLSEALHAFFVTNHPLFVVVNSFDEFVGVVSIENVLRQLVGHIPGDDFDQYADRAAVAGRHEAIQHSTEPPEAS